MKRIHYSDCALYNAPAYLPLPCNCGVSGGVKKFLEYIPFLFDALKERCVWWVIGFLKLNS